MNVAGRWLIGMAIPGLLFLTSCTGRKKEPSGQGGIKPMTVTGMVVTPKLLENRIFSTGTVQANEEVDLRSETPGRITAIRFEEGSTVTKGDLLLKINDEELQAQLKKLSLERDLAEDDVYRKQKLLEMKAVSQEEYDKSANQLAVLQAQTELLKAQIAKTEIFAPFSGMIGLRHVSPGEYISTTTPVASLVQTDPVKIGFTIPEKYREKVRKGTLISFTVEGIDSTFRGIVYAIEPRIDPSTRNVTLRAVCPNPRNLLTPGSFAKVGILLESVPGAMVVPTEAIIPQMNGQKVYVTREGKARSVMVTTGIRTEREVQVTGGLTPGDTLLLTGLLQLREDMSVTVRMNPSGQ